MNENTNKLQAILYEKGGEVRKSELAKLLEEDIEKIDSIAKDLKDILSNQGLIILITESTISMRTAPEYKNFIIDTQKKENENTLGQAGLEILSIIIYKNGATRSEIDYIRGVNSSSTIRQLVLRGLIEKIYSDTNNRSIKYEISPELLSHLGVSKVQDLSNYEEMSVDINEQLNAKST